MHIGIGTNKVHFLFQVLLTCDIPFVFYDGIAIEAGQRHGKQR
jgi:hypothetical protein